MHIPKIFFILTLITSTYSSRTMHFDTLPQNIIVQLIGNMRAHTLDKDSSIRTMSKHVTALSLTNKKWHNSLNSVYFTSMLIQSLTYQLHFNELRVANNILTPGGNAWRKQSLEGMGFY